MARKRDPDDEVDRFLASVADSLDLWKRTQHALDSSDLGLRKEASLDAFVRVAVEWEGFRSRWHIAAINRDSSAYRAQLEARFRASIKDRGFRELEPYVHVALPAQMSVATVQRLLDPLGRNISFSDNWTDRARAELANPYSAKVQSLSSADLRVVFASEKLRNAIVHRSASVIGLFIWVRIDDQRQRSLVTGYPGRRPGSGSRRHPRQYACRTPSSSGRRRPDVGSVAAITERD
jgi:hypothetical protein